MPCFCAYMPIGFCQIRLNGTKSHSFIWRAVDIANFVEFVMNLDKKTRVVLHFGPVPSTELAWFENVFYCLFCSL